MCMHTLVFLYVTHTLCRYSKPISVARSVMESCNANFLVGDGASSFACEQGFVMEDNETLLTAETKKAYVVCVCVCVCIKSVCLY